MNCRLLSGRRSSSDLVSCLYTKALIDLSGIVTSSPRAVRLSRLENAYLHAFSAGDFDP